MTIEWRPLSESALWDKLNMSWERMSHSQRWLWEVIRIPPAKWAQLPYGEAGGGFWAVAVIGSSVIWYNDIEEGFNRSSYRAFGVIEEYWCNEDELEWTVQLCLDEIQSGVSAGPYASPPKAGEFDA